MAPNITSVYLHAAMLQLLTAFDPKKFTWTACCIIIYRFAILKD